MPACPIQRLSGAVRAFALPTLVFAAGQHPAFTLTSWQPMLLTSARWGFGPMLSQTLSYAMREGANLAVIFRLAMLALVTVPASA
jgi:hypothetical protein